MCGEDSVIDDANKLLSENIILREYIQLLRKRVIELTKKTHRDGIGHNKFKSYRECHHNTCVSARAALEFTSDYNNLGE